MSHLQAASCPRDAASLDDDGVRSLEEDVAFGVDLGVLDFVMTSLTLENAEATLLAALEATFFTPFSAFTTLSPTFSKSASIPASDAS